MQKNEEKKILFVVIQENNVFWCHVETPCITRSTFKDEYWKQATLFPSDNFVDNNTSNIGRNTADL